MDIEYNPPRLLNSTGVVERALQKLKNLIITNLEDKIGLTVSINKTLRVCVSR